MRYASRFPQRLLNGVGGCSSIDTDDPSANRRIGTLTPRPRRNRTPRKSVRLAGWRASPAQAVAPPSSGGFGPAPPSSAAGFAPRGAALSAPTSKRRGNKSFAGLRGNRVELCGVFARGKGVQSVTIRCCTVSRKKTFAVARRFSRAGLGTPRSSHPFLDYLLEEVRPM